jgi:hypothetical protein
MKFKMGGSGIHIKPENKGKFTATKKATGKTTEELTHSKNPVTKKRAIFAQNAAKWKHDEGTKKLANTDSTAYYENQMKKFMKKRSSVSIDKAPPYDGKVNKAMSDMYRQGKKGKPGFDENGHPITKKMCGSKGMKYAEGTKSIKFKKPMMKRADGSTSQRGLWDNIRANKGSGKKPTAKMLKQEKKIKAGK